MLLLVKLLLSQLWSIFVRYYFKVDFVIKFILCKTRDYVIKSKTKVDDLVWKQGYKGAKEDKIDVPCEDIKD